VRTTDAKDATGGRSGWSGVNSLDTLNFQGRVRRHSLVAFTPSLLRHGAGFSGRDNMNKPFSLAVCAVCLLSSCGGSPTALLFVTSLTFSDQDVGTTSAAQPITLGNVGSATLKIDNIATTANFEQNNTCGSSVASGAGCTINVTFTPSSTGNFTGTLSITDNASGSPQTVSLSGTGVLPPPPRGCRTVGQFCNFNFHCCPGLVCRAEVGSLPRCAASGVANLPSTDGP